MPTDTLRVSMTRMRCGSTTARGTPGGFDRAGERSGEMQGHDAAMALEEPSIHLLELLDRGLGRRRAAGSGG